jgi:hypothetical protein
MRRVAALSVLFLCAGCAEGDEDSGSAVPVRDAQPDVLAIDSTLDDAPVAIDAATEADADVTTEEANDSIAADTIVDSVAPDTADTAVVDTGPVDAGPPWKHTIVVDGVNDYYLAQEKFQTTSIGYEAFITWDDSNIYVAYTGPDIGSTASPDKWLFVYIDVDPGMATGPASAERYNTQAPKFPTGFGAEFYMRWRTDNTDAAIKKWDSTGASWTFVTTMGTRQKLGGFVELRIPRSTLGTSTKFGLVSFMLNEKPAGEWTYAGLYLDNFVDGYSAAKPLTKYLLIDTTSPAAPNATSRIKP